MDYAIQILTALLDRYERRTGKSSRAVTIEIIKCCPAYRDHLSAEERNIDQAVTCLVDWQMIDAPRSPQGYYTKLTLHLDHLSEIYARLNRTPLADLRQAQRDMLLDAQQREPDSLAGRFAQTLLTQLDQGRALGYRLQDNVKKLRDVLLALEQIGRLDHETYIRNFSEGVFHDSKHFQNIADTVRSILIDLTDQPVEKSEILAYYNLLENPTYLYLKGSWVLELSDSRIPVAALPGGIGLTSDGLQAVRAVHLEHKTVVTVENLTTYHDTPSENQAVLYLGGFPNFARAAFLRLVYAGEPEAAYYHHGDLDPHGFLILENLKQKTGIPFRPLEMDLATLRACFQAGHYRPLTAEDKKAMQSPLLAPYREILDFMLQHNCKVEQESLAAMGLDAPSQNENM